MLLKPAGFMSTVAWPSQVAQCKIFCEDYKSFVTGGCGAWINQANTTPVTQVTESLRPDEDTDRFGTDNHGISFDGTDDYMLLDNVQTFAADFSLFVVVYRPTATSFDPIVNGGTDPTDIGFRQSSGSRNDIRFWNGSSAVLLTDNGSTPAGFKSILEIHRTNSGDFTVYDDNTDITISGGANDTNTLSIGRFGSRDGTPSDISIGAIAVYDEMVSGSLRTAIYNYFNARWST